MARSRPNGKFDNYGLSFDPEALGRELRREQHVRRIVEKRLVMPEPETVEPAKPSRFVVGRKAVDRSVLVGIQNHFADNPKVRFKDFEPTIIYASESFLKQTIGLSDAKAKISAYIDRAKRYENSLTEFKSVAIEALRPRSMKYGRIALVLEIQRDETTASMMYERRLLRNTLRLEDEPERGLKPLVMSLGALQITGATRQIKREINDLEIPEQVILAPVDAVELRPDLNI